jgi:riboflavin transporter FmnP
VKSKEIAILVLLAASAVVLNMTVGIPFAPLVGFEFGLDEIPIILAFLLFGFKFGTIIAAIDSLLWFMIYPNPFNPIGAMIAFLSMMLGIYMVVRPSKQSLTDWVGQAGKRKVAYALAMATFLRVVMVMPYTYGAVKLQIPDITDSQLWMYVFPWLAVYNVIQSFITLPLSFVISKTIRRNLRTALT